MSFRLPAVVLVLLIASCSGGASPPTATDARTGLVVTSAASVPDNALNFVAHAHGEEEVPPHPSLGQGEAIFHLNADGTELTYRLIASNIDNVVQSHIHIGPVGVNGPIVVFLFGPAAPGGGRTDGVLATGTITAANLIGPLAGHPLSDLLSAIQSGNAYVNVHTNDGVDGVNTGPGDFPGGEIRGQVDGGHVSH
jgi:CHRD domain-containing protein